jgi:hypothetical protein
MTGSKAYADVVSQLGKEKMEADTDVAEKATLAGKDFAESDRQFWLQGLQAAESGKKADTLLAMNAEQNAFNNTYKLGALGVANSETQGIAGRWTSKTIMDQIGKMGDTATGLAYLYGMNKSPSQSTLPAGTGYTNSFLNPGQSYMSYPS